jgi:hypothetical protein
MRNPGARATEPEHHVAEIQSGLRWQDLARIALVGLGAIWS